MLRTGFILLTFVLTCISLDAQVMINEASNKNYQQIADEDGDYNDWIELYNSGSTSVDLSDWALSDSKKNPVKWKFGDVSIPAQGFLFINASEKDINQADQAVTWESAVLPTDTFSYLIPTAETSTEWFLPEFDDSSWESGQAGFGYADDDDSTVLPTGTLTVYARKKFNVPDVSAITGAILNVDYDDGFIAYLNGVAIASVNMNENPEWNSVATTGHEAIMYSGSNPEAFEIDFQTLESILREGENVFCIEGHNLDATSTDLSLIPFLTFSLQGGKSFFQSAPSWFSNSSEGQLHTNFKLSSEGEKIFLSHDSIIVDSVKVPEMLLDHSYGRVTDGALQFGYFIQATPGASNNSSSANTLGYTLKPELNYGAGFYTSAIDVTMTSFDSGSTIRYTIDGSDPIGTSAIYSAPIKISATKCLKARSFTSDKLPGAITTATYFINDDYTLPVLSVSTKVSNLYGTSGIFDNINESWNIPAYVEYFEKDQLQAFAQNAGMQLDGGAGGSRSNAQHSFRIETGHSTLGDGDLKYKLMPRRPNRERFPSFYLRNGSNQYLTLPYKDALEVTALGQNTYTYYSAYHPVVVFINGGYFGVYELREKINDDYLEDNYKVDTDSIDLLGVSYFKGTLNGGEMFGAIKGSTAPFISDYNRFLLMDTQSEDYLTEVDKFLDIQNYTDYIIAEDWVGNNDWPENNIKMWRCKGTNYRWQWAITDLEWALMPNYWTTSSFDHIAYMLGYGTNNYYTSFWYNMMDNSEYKAYFINRYADLMNTNYQYSVVGSLEDEMFNEIYPEMDGEFAKWNTSSNMTTQLSNFTKNHVTFQSELKRRSNVVRGQLQSHYSLSKQVTVTLDVEPREAGSIQISTIIPSGYPWEGIYFTNIPVTVTALPNPGYRFINWDENAFLEDAYNATNTGYFTSSTITLKAYFETDDDSDEGVVISEINYKSATDSDIPDWFEICNLSKSDVNLNGWYFTDDDSTHVFAFSTDLILAPKERIVVSNDFDKLKKLNPSVSVYPSAFDFGLGTEDEINLYNAQKELIKSVHYSDQYPWPLSNDLTGRSLELRQAGNESNQPMAWFRGCIGGSPGNAYSPCEEVVVSSPTVAEANQFDVKVYPIPANDFVNVEIQQTEQKGECTARLYDFMGNLVKTISFGETTSGWNSFQLQLNDVRGNMLFLKVNTGSYEKTVKILRMDE